MVDTNATRKTSAVPEITPLDRYDFGRAKIHASVRWLLVKAYGSGEGVPADLREPLSHDATTTTTKHKQPPQPQQEDQSLKPAVARLLLSCELYRRAYASVQQGAPTAQGPKDHGGLLQALAKRGLEAAVSEGELACLPIKVGAHLAVIDAMMTLAAMDTVGGVKMAKEVEQFGGGPTWENALLFWVNKLIQKLRESTDTEEVPKPQPTCTDLQPVQPSCPTRWYWKLVPHAIAFCLKESGNKPPVIRYRKDKVQSKQTPTFPFVSEMKDLSNGCAIAAVLHFYCPTLLRLEDVCLRDTMSVADSLYNLQLIRDFCERWLKGCCPLVLEDLLYTPPTLKLNIMCFMAELLKWFEVQKPDIVQPLLTLDLTDASGLDGCTSPMNGNSNSGSPSFIFKQPFLPITSPVSPAGGSEGKGWTKKQLSRPLSAVAFSIPFPLDSDVDVVMGNPLFRSVSTDSLTAASTAMTHHHPYTPPEDLSHMIPPAQMGELPTIEEALHIIHAPNGGVAVRQRPEGAPAGFYLHSPGEDDPGSEEEAPGSGRGNGKMNGGSRLSCSAPSRSMLLRRPVVGVDSPSEGTAPPVVVTVTAASTTTGSHNNASPPVTPGKARTMTSFAARRRRQPESPMTPSEPASTPDEREGTGTSSPRRPAPRGGGGGRGDDGGDEDSPSVSSPAGQAEAWELASRLEEKRRAIESQKRRIEAIFTRHRQRLGKTAFLQLKREQGEGEGGEKGGGGGEVDSMSLEERLSRMEEELQREEEKEKDEDKETAKEEKEKEREGGEKAPEEEVGSGSGKAAPKLEKQVTFSVETRKGQESGAAPLSQYDDAVTKLSSALQALQKDMQKLTEQQQKLMGGAKKTTPTKTTPFRKTPPPSKAWVIPASPKGSASASASASVPRLSRESTRDMSPSSPSRSAHNHQALPSAAPKSPQATATGSASAGRKTPKSPSSTVPKSPSSTVPKSPSSTVPKSPSSTVPKSPSSTVPKSPSSTVPKSPSSTVPKSPSSTVPKSPSSTVPKSPSSTVPKSPSSTVPKSPSSTVPKSPSSTVPKSPSSTVPKSPSSTVPKSPSSTVPKSPSSTVPKSPSSTVPKSPSSTVPKSPSSTVPKSPSSQSPGGQRACVLPTMRFPLGWVVLTTPQSVDTLPHLRRVSPSKCQVQTLPVRRSAGGETPRLRPPRTGSSHALKPEESTSESGSSDEHVAMFSLELDVGPPPAPPATITAAQALATANASAIAQALATANASAIANANASAIATGAAFPRPPGSVAGGSSVGGGSSSGAPSECSFDSDLMISGGLTDGEVEVETEGEGGGEGGGEDSEQLLEEALSSLQGPLGGGEETDQELGPEIFSSDSMSDQTESDTKGGVGFFFREEGLSEEEMAQRKAALLERQQRRAEEMRRRRQEQERENSRASSADELRLSQSLPTSSFFAPPPVQRSQATPPSTPQRRGNFTREEYERRHQLKIMSDLDKVLRQKPSTSKQQKQQQQKQQQQQQHKQQQHKHRANKSQDNNAVITKSPAKKKTDSSSAGAMTNGPLSAVKPPSRSNSPAGRTMSPCRPANQNGDKDWENGSGASSPASLPEYTGPKLYREPSFKSNKFIINNALSRCCLAGKVNQTQKDKIIEEIEKSSANHFLILFRDSHCQFRAVYTAGGGGGASGNSGVGAGAGSNSGGGGESSEELVRLCGVGPRVISCADVEAIYKYSSDRKQFSAIPSKTMSMSVDAFTIPAHLWHTKKQSTPKKVATPK
ncbi:LOW QUALITY PROTEIN: calmodulin-regulated spectrin-associated protein 3 [Alosa alosa]|uniref:LOW QUALITY PROTEIN: calmodulin-regulated spectrin-associated protein 3 n=1 Tax=Alosa alosa TaxID=278164 RepID=UPI0020152CA3|nr:LOW QUALITY PROTEIN: calmodulin-regulated spectrin-associated protein 3 [Alosa alosa]